MQLTPQAKAVMLLTVSFGQSDPQGVKQLSNSEWARFAIWLNDHGLEPSSLLKGDLPTLLPGWMDRSVTVARLQALLARGAALGLALEKWNRAGLWVVSRADPDYPERLKLRLRSESPAVLFGCGNKSLLNRGGVAVVGSRDATEDDLAFTEKLGKNAATQGYSIISGGARGIDQSAIIGALKSRGTAVGVLADSLLRSATSAKYRKPVMSGDLVLMTPFNPEAGFNVGNAMSRNRYIYCLADAAVVVSSTPGKGGTWNGAFENLKAAWVPLWVKHNISTNSGNWELVRMGAHWLPDNLKSIATLLNTAEPSPASEGRRELPLPAPESEHLTTIEPETNVIEDSYFDGGTTESRPQVVNTAELAPSISVDQVEMDFYKLFLIRMLDIAADRPMKAEDIAACLELKKSQVNAWLERGVSDRKIEKLTKPIRYQAAAGKRQQASLFEEGG
jgi:predicted Rossmann fold nucleotide-binding protein DprA/Smf involved in DNA uptake